MTKLAAYVERVLSVAELPPHDEQGEELQAHLEDLTREFERAGLVPAEAEMQALAHFGAADEVGMRLRETTPLRLSLRDWLRIGAGSLMLTLALRTIGLYNFGNYLGTLWAAVLLAGLGLVTFGAQRPLTTALLTVTGVSNLLLALNNFVSIHWQGGIGFVLRAFFAMPIIHPSPTSTRWLTPDGAVYLVSGLVLGYYVLRWLSQLVPHLGPHLLAGLVHLLPLLSMFGLSEALLGVAAAGFIWLWGRAHNTFVARHALQAAIIGVASFGLLLTYYPVFNRFGVMYEVRSAALLLRLAFGWVAMFAATAAASGHDFRYPFARLLLGRRWGRLPGRI